MDPDRGLGRSRPFGKPLPQPLDQPPGPGVDGAGAAGPGPRAGRRGARSRTSASRRPPGVFRWGSRPMKPSRCQPNAGTVDACNRASARPRRSSVAAPRGPGGIHESTSRSSRATSDVGDGDAVDLAEPPQALGLDAELPRCEAGGRLGEDRAPVAQVDPAGLADATRLRPGVTPTASLPRAAATAAASPDAGAAAHAAPEGPQVVDQAVAGPLEQVVHVDEAVGRRRSTGSGTSPRSASGPKAVMRWTLARAAPSGAARSSARSTVASATSSRSKRSQSSGRTLRARCAAQVEAPPVGLGDGAAVGAVAGVLGAGAGAVDLDAPRRARPARRPGASPPRRWATGRCSPSTRTARGRARRAGRGRRRGARRTSDGAYRPARAWPRSGCGRAAPALYAAQRPRTRPGPLQEARLTGDHVGAGRHALGQVRGGRDPPRRRRDPSPTWRPGRSPIPTWPTASPPTAPVAPTRGRPWRRAPTSRPPSQARDGPVLVDSLGTWVAAHDDLGARRRRPGRRPPGPGRTGDGSDGARVRGGGPRASTRRPRWAAASPTRSAR